MSQNTRKTKKSESTKGIKDKTLNNTYKNLKWNEQEIFKILRKKIQNKKNRKDKTVKKENKWKHTHKKKINK